MKRKFLITNDVGLAKDKIKSVLNVTQDEPYLSLGELDELSEMLIEVLSHLEQCLENLGEED